MNTFGSVPLQFALCDVRSVLDNRARFRREDLPLLEHVNHFYCPSGRWPSRGWVLLPRYEYDQLDKYSTTFQLNVGDSIALKNLCAVQARCVTRGLASDRNALYLIELTDGRGVLHNRWFQFPITAAYNIRAPAYPGTFHPGSLNGGAAWSWSTMLQDMWTQMSAFLGVWPGLPTTPAGTPEGFWFQGVPAWHALCDVLDHLGMTVACDLTAANPFTIVVDNAVDLAYDALLLKYASALEDDLEWIDVGAARLPGAVKVLFRRRNEVYGTEETVRYDSPFQWDMQAYYAVSVGAPVAGGVGTHYLWDDFTVRYDQDSNPLAADVVTAAAIATERVTQYFARINPDNHTKRTYAGALPFVTGSQVDGVCWYMEGYAGWRTQVVYGPNPPWPDLWDDLAVFPQEV